MSPDGEGELTVEADITFDGYFGDQALTGAGFGPHGFARTWITGFRRPRRVHFAAALPRNASMKVRKDQLRDQLAREGSTRA